MARVRGPERIIASLAGSIWRGTRALADATRPGVRGHQVQHVRLRRLVQAEAHERPGGPGAERAVRLRSPDRRPRQHEEPVVVRDDLLADEARAAGELGRVVVDLAPGEARGIGGSGPPRTRGERDDLRGGSRRPTESSASVRTSGTLSLVGDCVWRCWDATTSSGATAERCEMSVRSVTSDPPKWAPRCLPGEGKLGSRARRLCRWRGSCHRDDWDCPPSTSIRDGSSARDRRAVRRRPPTAPPDTRPASRLHPTTTALADRGMALPTPDSSVSPAPIPTTSTRTAMGSPARVRAPTPPPGSAPARARVRGPRPHGSPGRGWPGPRPTCRGRPPRTAGG